MTSREAVVEAVVAQEVVLAETAAIWAVEAATTVTRMEEATG